MSKFNYSLSNSEICLIVAVLAITLAIFTYTAGC
jgi:hypothetical protein